MAILVTRIGLIKIRNILNSTYHCHSHVIDESKMPDSRFHLQLILAWWAWHLGAE